MAAEIGESDRAIAPCILCGVKRPVGALDRGFEAVVGEDRGQACAGRNREGQIGHALADDRWRVRLSCDGILPPRVVADVRAVQREAAVLTCQAPRATSARAFVVDALEPDGR